ncbi:MAG: hypothetical protein ACI9DF_005328, partial [Verrucomicrobiales bacterium]
MQIDIGYEVAMKRLDHQGRIYENCENSRRRE